MLCRFIWKKQRSITQTTTHESSLKQHAFYEKDDIDVNYMYMSFFESYMHLNNSKDTKQMKNSKLCNKSWEIKKKTIITLTNEVFFFLSNKMCINNN